MDDLSEFLLARITEEQAEAEAASVDQWGHRVGSREGFEWMSLALSSERDTTRVQDEFIGHWDPARVLADCEAKRQVVDVYRVLAVGRHDVGSPRWHEVIAYETVLRQLSLPYADHPDYRAEWRP